MRKILSQLSFSAAAALLLSCNSTQKSADENQILIENSSGTAIEIPVTSVEKSMTYLSSDELRGRETGTEGINKAAHYIERVFESAGVKPYFKTYRDSFQVQNKTGYNVVGYLEGNDPALKDEFIILGAHYDHIGLGKVVNGDSIANGANDNAAGTVAVLELAKHFAERGGNKRSMLFTLFSAEELGLEGAKQLASKLKSRGIDLYAMVNFEMIGIPMEGKDHLAYLTGYENSNMAEKFNEYSGGKVLGFLPQAKQYNLFQRSDNFPFYQEFKVPAQTISTFDFTNYDYYHHVSDEADKMDYQHMVKLIEQVIPALTKMTETSEKEIKLTNL